MPAVQGLASLVRSLVSQGVGAIFAVGGDGTAHALVNAVASAAVPLGILPSGGGNDFAAALGLPPDPVASARLLLDGIAISVDLARARTADGEERLFVAGGGIGLDVQALRFANSVYKKWPGKLRYLASAVRAWKNFKPFVVRVEAPDNSLASLEKEVLSCAVLNTPAYGAGIKLAPQASLQDGCLELVFVAKISPPRLMRVLPGLIARGILPESLVERVLVRSVRITPDRPCLFQADGELLGLAPVEVAVVPNAVRVLVPASFFVIRG